MANRFNALVVATLVGVLFGAVVGAGFGLYDILRWWMLQSLVPSIVAAAKVGGVTGFTFALSLLAWFVLTRRVIGPVGGTILGGVCSLIGLQAYLVAQPPICLVGSSVGELYSLALLGVPFGSLVGVAARSGSLHEARVPVGGSASNPPEISPA
ncbi:MAG: hypothetical protein P8188_09965 [Gemmatimonadota bacterium]